MEKYYAIDSKIIKQIPEGWAWTIERGDEYNLDHLLYALSFQPAIYTDEKYPVGVVEGEIEVDYQIHESFMNDWIPALREQYDSTYPEHRRLFATRKREEVEGGASKLFLVEYTLNGEQYSVEINGRNKRKAAAHFASHYDFDSIELFAQSSTPKP